MRVPFRLLHVMAALVLFVGGTAHANLLSEHFGVELSLTDDPVAGVGEDASGAYLFNHDWTPTSSSANYVVNDWQSCYSSTDFSQCADGVAGGEVYDVEALYFDDDYHNLYVAVVTSFPSAPGHQETRGIDQLIVGGDLALDLGLNDDYGDGFRYDYGVNLNPENRTTGNATSGGTAVGDDIYRTANSDWYIGTPQYAADTPGDTDELSNFDPEWDSFSGGSQVGEATVSYDLVTFGGGHEENDAPTYVIGVTIPRSALPPLGFGDTVGVSWVMGCRNDGDSTAGVIRFDDDDPATISTPAPGTLALLGVCLGALVGWRRRERQ